MRFPEAIRSGDKVAILATAKRLEGSLERTLKVLKNWELKPVVYESARASFKYFAGNDKLRTSDLQSALDDPEVKAILFLRGGYGSTRIIDGTDFSLFKNKPKWLIGFSDVTSILLQAVSLGVPSIHGPVAITLGQDSSSDIMLFELLKGTSVFNIQLSRSVFTKEGVATGCIVGGNLSMIYESIGAKNEVDIEGNILFLEEVGEEYYAVDRMMNKLKRIGKLENLNGLILGSFTSISDRQSYFDCSIEELVLSYFEGMDIPMVVGFSAGHEKKNYPLMFGAKARINVGLDNLEIDYIK